MVVKSYDLSTVDKDRDVIPRFLQLRGESGWMSTTGSSNVNEISYFILASQGSVLIPLPSFLPHISEV